MTKVQLLSGFSERDESVFAEATADAHTKLQVSRRRNVVSAFMSEDF